jgi:hypothetical protein
MVEQGAGMGVDDGGEVPDLVSAFDLLDEVEVGAALGMPVTAQSVPEISFMPSTTTIFRPVGNKAIALLVQTSRGWVSGFVLRVYGRGQALPGIGERAWLGRRRAVAHQAGITVILRLKRAGAGREQQLPRLLAAAVSRLPR